ncbi:MAG: hypothetical protein NC300_10915 [Bacteroidales bacterium]|nr:hypothetical protein [Clostridium sp.]MCM1204642.1 hypothetical protein [Bacteroidales bacterium]
MKINSSTINMNANRLFSSSTATTQTTKNAQTGTGVTTYFSSSFQFNYMEYSSAFSRKSLSKGDNHPESGDTSSSDEPLPSDLYSNLGNKAIPLYDARASLENFHRQLMEHLEQLMERIKNQLLGITTQDSKHILDLTTGQQPGTLWTKQTYQSVTVTESEATTFQGNGSVVTADGRTIDFNISMEMSRSFTETSETLTTETQYILTDPLVIHLDNAPDTISDQKWLFDIDGDGKKEEISQLAKGKGFLALDANNNGKIDDGSELFGTKSGNGFKDLAAYDDDGNGWIDENDAVYAKLKVWVKDASGSDKLIGLGQADIGAIYLGSAATQFAHKTADTNDTQAVVRQTGLYLHESTGAAGTIQQIDFATK